MNLQHIGNFQLLTVNSEVSRIVMLIIFFFSNAAQDGQVKIRRIAKCLQGIDLRRSVSILAAKGWLLCLLENWDVVYLDRV